MLVWCAAASALATWIATSTASLDLDSSAHQTLTQRLAFDQFTGNVMNRVILADLVNRQNIWMIESNHGACFLLKPLQALGVTSKRIGKSLSAAFRPAVMSVAR